MYKVLTDARHGLFESANVELLLGEQADADSVKTILRRSAELTNDLDFLLVYFAGHAVLDPGRTPVDAASNLYVGTADLDFGTIRTRPDSLARMSFFRGDVFQFAQGNSLLLLDCCEAGGYLAEAGQEAEDWASYGTFLAAATEAYVRQLARHSAILACQQGAQARESTEHRHGIFTSHLLDTLRRGGGEVVTVKTLMKSVDASDLSVQTTKRGWAQDIELTRPDPESAVHPQTVAPTAELMPLPHPMSPLLDPLYRLLRRLFQDETTRLFQKDGASHARERDRLDRLVRALEAKAAVLVDLAEGGVRKIEASTSFLDAYNLNMDDLRELFAPLSRQVIPSDRGALAHVWSRPDMQVLAVPLHYLPDRHVRTLLVFDPARAFLDMYEPLGHLLAATWRERSDHAPGLAELNVVTQLRAEFGRVPNGFYRYCFDLYQQQLSSIEMAFEPIVQIGPLMDDVGIDGWEALARTKADPDRAPADILQAAEVWGSEFVVKRDSVLAGRAIQSYRESLRLARNVERWTGNIRPLSINVAVPALLSDDYIEAVIQAIRVSRLGPGQVTLEISERDRIAPEPDEDWGRPALDFFRDRLGQIANRHHLNFAIDDFGVGYASLQRIAELPIAHIKVDRAVLGHPLALKELQLVVDVAKHLFAKGWATAPRKVIVEGYDEAVAQNVSLQDIYGTGVQYVQGYLVGRAASLDLGPLEDEARNRIANEVASPAAPVPRRSGWTPARPD